MALGGSTAVGVGASGSGTSYVGLYFEHLRATGTGVSLVSNLAVGGATTSTLLDSQLPRALAEIRKPTDAEFVTITIGSNDLGEARCARPNAPSCPVGANLRATPGALATALRADPGPEVMKVTTGYNPFFDDARRRSGVDDALLGTDRASPATGPAVRSVSTT